MSTFVDSSVWFAAAVARDSNNGLAKSILLSLDGWRLTDHVLAETWQLLSARFGREAADTFWERLRQSGAVIEPVTASDLEAASRIGTTSTDGEYSLVDRTSFAVMERLGITRAASFNPSFSTYRYGRRKQAFQIVRSGHSSTFAALRQAMLHRRPVRLTYGRKEFVVCPYVLGHAVGEERAFVLVVNGTGERKESKRGNWICLRVAKIQNIETIDGPWINRAFPGPVQRCVDQVHLDVRQL
ncbi:PIN domain-containing protein [Bradyrhizobium diazoefficiens]|uniref:type II toxin-antitoxin system VapC family toxin n=1 Tax=Bradyrhizobium diazoefficiens TaxID=1355477 RepID=UPI00190A0A97|nr:PIN domain-containing protein [Bradyrhizobium diazoefficiens]QQO12571.1 PIN domain-containing protein [Bradyrhizobium diazoefficiens]